MSRLADSRCRVHQVLAKIIVGMFSFNHQIRNQITTENESIILF
jgi:hypothetical protein